MEEDNSSKDFFWQTYEKLPDSLKEALFSEENYDIVSAICEKHGITDEGMKSQILKYVGKTLMGMLPIKEFSITVELEMDLDTEVAQAIASDIDSQIFSHLRIELNKLYLEEVAKKRNMGDNKKAQKETKSEAPGPKKPEAAPAPKDSDAYREPIN